MKGIKEIELKVINLLNIKNKMQSLEKYSDVYSSFSSQLLCHSVSQDK
jgi:hypothetical protein